MTTVFQVLLDEEEEDSQPKLRKPRVFKDRYVVSPFKGPVVMFNIKCGQRSNKRWLIRAFAVCRSHLRILICLASKLFAVPIFLHAFDSLLKPYVLATQLRYFIIVQELRSLIRGVQSVICTKRGALVYFPVYGSHKFTEALTQATQYRCT